MNTAPKVMTFRCLSLLPIPFPSARSRSISALALLATGLIGCSSDSKHPDAFDQQGGSASSVGLADSLPQQRPAVIDLDRLEGDNGYSLVFESEDFGSALDESEEWVFPLESTQRLQGIGDVDGDGISDFTFNTSSRTWLVSGRSSRQPADTSVNLVTFSDTSDLAGVSGVTETPDTFNGPGTFVTPDTSNSPGTLFQHVRHVRYAPIHVRHARHVRHVRHVRHAWYL